MPLTVVVTKPAPIKLSRPIASNGSTNSLDVFQVKRTLNRLGYYTPPKNIGITDIPDTGLFSAIKEFQKALGLTVTGTINPDDDTLNTLNTKLSKQKSGHYIWHTVGDSHVRGAHKELEGTIRSWDISPTPGEDFNCRCWAEQIAIEETPIINKEMDRRSSILNNTKAIFNIDIDPQVNSDAPWYEDIFLAKTALSLHSKEIENAAKKHDFDADLVKAIMWAENARGGQFGVGYVLDKVKLSSTVMPLNINPNLWGELITKNKNDLYRPEKNIEAATILLKRIKARIINPTPEKIAAIWQFGGAEKTNNYSAYIGRIYKEKPWLKNKKKH